MTFAALLNEDQKRIWTEERAVLERTLDVLSGWEAAPADLEHLRRALQQLDELFLLVVVGEFNSGKSALINALLGEAFLPEGPTPTTDRVYVLAHGHGSWDTPGGSAPRGNLLEWTPPNAGGRGGPSADLAREFM